MTIFSEPGQYFLRHQGAVNLAWDLVDNAGLRRAQLGAAWAIAAHGTVSKEPALVVLPTGVGKTLVLCLAPFLLRARRVLVVTPGKLVRTQVADAFETLVDLKRAELLPADLPSPRIARVEHRATADDWIDWRSVDVVIGTPNVLSDGYPDVQRLPTGLFDLVIFDEAHHLPARVWTAILDATDAASVLLTATPTRRDGKPLPGDIVYSYPLSQAIADRVYSPVRFLPVAWDETADPDRTLAEAAAERLRDPIHQGAGSRLLVRTGTQVEARDLVGVYADVGLELGLVLGDTPPNKVRQILTAVREGELHGFVAVGAMIEGFDFPKLKVAAYHHPHRSLAPTIQFLGRLSRATPQGVRGELLAIPDLVEGETRELYREDRDWAELMPEIVDAAQLEERAIRRYVAGAHVAGDLDLPPRALTPPRSARIYRLPPDVVPSLDVSPDRIGRADVVFRFYDAATALVAFVTHRVVAQRWAETPLLEVPEFALHLATWVEANRALFVSTESGPALDDMLEAFDVIERVRGLSPDDLVRLVYAANPGSYFSVGLHAAQARRARGASYDMTAGRAVETALDYADRTGTMLGHLMARPSDGNRGTLGFSVAKSKLWEPENARSLLEFRRWALERGADLDRPAPAGGLPGLDVRIGQPFADFDAAVLGAAVNHSILIGEVILLHNHESIAPFRIDAVVRRVDDEAIEIVLTVDDDRVWRGAQTATGYVSEAENDGVQFLDAPTGEIIDVSRALRDAPLSVYFVDGSMVIGDVKLPRRDDVGRLPADLLVADGWPGITISQELGTSGSVQARTSAIASASSTWTATDHGSGELADFIALTVGAGPPRLQFFHCKGSGGPSPGRRVGDLYEVLGQAIKNVPWTIVPTAIWPEMLRRLDDRNAFRLVDGDEATFREELERLRSGRRREIEVEIVAVQPGVSISDLQDWPIGRALVHAASQWCSGENVNFRLLGSP